MTRRALVALASYVVALSLLTVAVIAMTDAEPEAMPEPILAPASLVVAEAAALHATPSSRGAVSFAIAAVSTTQDESEEVRREVAPAGDSDTEVGAGRSSAVPTSGPAPSATPHQLTVTDAGEAQSEGQPRPKWEAAGSTPAPGTTNYAHLAACGPDCWGDQLTRAEVEALALSVTGDAAWSAWAAGCFTGGGENRGYVGAVGGPNWDGSYDVGLPQINTVHATWADLTRALGDPAYAVETAYALWQVQGYAAWRGC